MVINLQEMFTRCSWRNTNSKYFNKMWPLVKYSLLVVMWCWRRNVSWVQTGFPQLVLSVVTLLRWQTLSCSVMKNVYCISTKQHGGIKSGILQSQNSTISQLVRASALSCWNV